MKKICKPDYVLAGILFLLPFLNVSMGVNVTDQGYNLANFELFPHMNQTWAISTLAANLVGKVFTWLPFGHYMLGMNVYCTLLLSIFTVVMYNILRKDFSKYAVFCGLLIAVCFSWAPKVTLYQYLSYFLFNGAAVLVLMGLRKEDRRLLFGAGVLLGINLFVRFPNILQAALIVVVLYAAILQKKCFKEWITDVLVCIAGYFVIAVPGILLIELLWGRGAYLGMINSLFAMTDTATAYSPFAMFTSVYYAYMDNWYWFKWFLILVVFGVLVWGFLKKKWQRLVVFAGMVFGLVLILCFYSYRGMLNTHYEGYHSVYVWGANLLMFTGIFMAFAVCLPRIPYEIKLYGLAVLVIIGITPLGSNNVLYSNYNNLYLLAPVTVGMVNLLWKKVRREEDTENGRIWRISGMPAALVGSALILITIIQTSLFHNAFVFGDTGITMKTGTKIAGNERLTGMITTPENGKALGELTVFVAENYLNGMQTIVWDQAPILYYILDIECPIGHFWPWLDSYPYAEFKADIEAMEEYPMVIYQTTYYEDLIKEIEDADQKTQLIMEILQEGAYEEVFRNAHYVVCLPGQIIGQNIDKKN